MRAQLELMALSGKTMFNVLLGRASRRLAELAPGDLQISFWCNSGTEAIEGAIKLARAATGRAKIVCTHDAFHGKTLGALSVSGRETFQTPFRPLLATSRTSRSATPSALDGALHDAAAFVVEPVQGEGGVNVPPEGYLARGARGLRPQPARSSSPTKCRRASAAAATASAAIATASCPT